MKNFMIDVAFSVEGPWEKFEDIPIEAFIDGMERRWRELRNSNEIDAFGDCGDAYDVETLET